MNDKPMNIDRHIKLIKKYLNFSKPNGVSNIEFNLRSTGDKNEYYMEIAYIVPDGSEFLQQDRPRNHRQDYINYRYNWNYHISKDLKNYFGLKVIINNSSTINEKFYNGK